MIPLAVVSSGMSSPISRAPTKSAKFSDSIRLPVRHEEQVTTESTSQEFVDDIKQSGRVLIVDDDPGIMADGHADIEHGKPCRWAFCGVRVGLSRVVPIGYGERGQGGRHDTELGARARCHRGAGRGPDPPIKL